MKTFLLSLCLLIANISNAQRDPITPDPINVEGYIRGDPKEAKPGGSDGGSGKKETGGKKNPPKSERNTKISINGETFVVSKEGEKNITEFIQTYSVNENVGGFVAVIAAIYSLFDVFTLDNNIPVEISVKIKLNTLDTKELITKLSSPNIWNRAVRTRAIENCESEETNAIANGKWREAEMWIKIRDIFANPERYKEGGIKYNEKEKKLEVRSLPATAYRSISGFDLELTALDKTNLLLLYDYLMGVPSSRDFIFYADFILQLKNINTINPHLTARDKIYLNYALLSLSSQNKNFLASLFHNNSIHKNQNYELWNTLKIYLYEDKWNSGRVPDTSIDSLGFWNDDLPVQSDIVTGEFPIIKH